MVYLILADVVVAIHLAYVSYVVFGQLLIGIGIPLHWQWIRNKWFRLTHLAMILIVAGESLTGITCPLTTWEEQLLEAAGQPREHRSFVGRLMANLMFCDCSDTLWVWPVSYCLMAAIVLATLAIAPPRWRRAASKQPMAQ
jgi:hypothetical protein